MAKERTWKGWIEITYLNPVKAKRADKIILDAICEAFEKLEPKNKVISAQYQTWFPKRWRD